MHRKEGNNIMAEKIADIGAKLLYAVVAIMLTTMFGASINLWSKTSDLAQENNKAIAVIETRTEYLISTVNEIKLDVKSIKESNKQVKNE